MHFPYKAKEAILLSRLNRFSALVEREGKREAAYLPNSGRMAELLVPGRRVFLWERASPQRRTRYDLALVALDNLLVSVDSRMPAEILYEALQSRALPPFRDYSSVQREFRIGESRLDFLLTEGNRRCLLEAKSVTLVRQGRALFPDAPTLRGRRHLGELIRARKQGWEAAVVFIIQREDASVFAPNDATDPPFGALLRQAREEGVAVYAYSCHVSIRGLSLAGEMPLGF